MSNRPWREDEEDWSETGGDGDDYDSSYGDSDDDDSDATISCPNCRAAIYAELDHCPRCGHWFIDADRAARETGLFATRRVRLIAAALLAIFVFSLLAELLLFG